MYIKAHHFGYTPIKNKNGRKSHYGETLKKIQVVRMRNGQTRTIYHYDVYALGGLTPQC